MDKQKKCFGDGNEWMKWDDIISMAVRSYIRNFIEKTSFIRVLVVLNILFICCNSNIHAGYYWNEQIKRRRRRRKKCTRQKSHLSEEAKTSLCVYHAAFRCVVRMCIGTISERQKRFHSFVNGCEQTQFRMETFQEWASESALNTWMNEQTTKKCRNKSVLLWFQRDVSLFHIKQCNCMPSSQWMENIHRHQWNFHFHFMRTSHFSVQLSLLLFVHMTFWMCAKWQHVACEV